MHRPNGRNKLASLTQHEKWWDRVMSGFLLWQAAGGFNASMAEDAKIAPPVRKHDGFITCRKEQQRQQNASAAG